MFVFVGEVAILCHITHSWKYMSTKDMTLWFLFAGLPMACSANTNLSENGLYFRNAILENLKFIILVSFVINYYTFSLWIELIWVPVICIFGTLVTVNEIKQKDTRVKMLLNVIGFCFGIFIFVYAIKSLIYDYPNWLTYKNAFSLMMPLIFSILYIPVAYFTAIVFDYEQMFIRVSWFQDKCSKRELTKRKWLIFLSCRLSWKRINDFSRYYVHRLHPSMTKEEFLHELSDFNGERLFIQDMEDWSNSEELQNQ
jgi:hypothetical protein